MRTNYLILGATFVLVGGCLLFFLKGHTPSAPFYGTVSSSSFRYEVVINPADQERGLGGRADVPENYGMLFVFPRDGSYGFWMKDMQVPIDIIWLSDTGTIAAINASVATSTYPDVFYPPAPVRYVLETRSGEAARLGWVVGTALPLPSQIVKTIPNPLSP